MTFVHKLTVYLALTVNITKFINEYSVEKEDYTYFLL